MRQPSLFDESSLPIEPAPDRTEPDLWIRRLRIIDRLDPDCEIIREVEFRKGLNIICTAERPPGESRTVGHSVGKTLLQRLIRYCLGEAAFCTKTVRSAICDKFPAGFVLAEIHLHGQPWIIARPIGMDSASSASWATRNKQMDDMLGDPEHRGRFSEFVEELEQTVGSCLTMVEVPTGRHKPGWLDLLAWLARDQGCRFRHHHEWRDPESQSGTGRLQREEASLVIRAVMGLIHEDEVALRASHNRLLQEQATLETEVSRFDAFLDLTAVDLRGLLDIPDDAPAGELLGPVANKAAEERAAQLHRLLEEAESESGLEGLLENRTEAAKAVARADAEVTRLEGLRGETEAELRQLEGADRDSYYASYEQQAGWCRLFTTKDDAVRRGCPGVGPDLKPGERDPRQQARIDECQAHAERLCGQLAEANERVASLCNEETEAGDAYRVADQAHQKKVAEIRRRIARYETLAERADRYGKGWSDFHTLEKREKAKAEAIEASREAQQQVRMKVDDLRAKLSSHFDATLKALLGAEAGGSIEMDARGIQPRPSAAVAASGEALGTSATVLGFDVACLIASVCGVGSFPRLLMHDSPREADMEEQMYHRLFELVADLEEAFGDQPPSFQYIVTTTTPPPKRLAGPPYVRLELDARQDEGLLLRTRT